MLHISYRELEIERDTVIQMDTDREAVANLEPVLTLKSVPLEAHRGRSGVGERFLTTGQFSKTVIGGRMAACGMDWAMNHHLGHRSDHQSLRSDLLFSLA